VVDVERLPQVRRPATRVSRMTLIVTFLAGMATAAILSTEQVVWIATAGLVTVLGWEAVTWVRGGGGERS
jgi:hypothetical protein